MNQRMQSARIAVGVAGAFTALAAITVLFTMQTATAHKRQLSQWKPPPPIVWRPERSTDTPPPLTRVSQAGASTTVSAAQAYAAKIFAVRCVACHGSSGQGNGPAGKALKPPPRNYTDMNWQRSVTDEHIAKIIVNGGLSVRKSALMPPNPDLAGRPEVVKALVAIVRGFGSGETAAVTTPVAVKPEATVKAEVTRAKVKPTPTPVKNSKPVVAKPTLKRAPAPKPKPKKMSRAVARGQARAIFSGRCSACHGMSGRGNGPASKALKPPPRNYTDKAWQRSVTNVHIAKIIVNGGPSVGKSPLMPPNPDLASKPEVVKALVGIVRSFGR